VPEFMPAVANVGTDTKASTASMARFQRVTPASLAPMSAASACPGSAACAAGRVVERLESGAAWLAGREARVVPGLLEKDRALCTERARSRCKDRFDSEMALRRTSMRRSRFARLSWCSSSALSCTIAADSLLTSAAGRVSIMVHRGAAKPRTYTGTHLCSTMAGIAASDLALSQTGPLSETRRSLSQTLAGESAAATSCTSVLSSVRPRGTLRTPPLQWSTTRCTVSGDRIKAQSTGYNREPLSSGCSGSVIEQGGYEVEVVIETLCGAMNFGVVKLAEDARDKKGMSALPEGDGTADRKWRASPCATWRDEDKVAQASFITEKGLLMKGNRTVLPRGWATCKVSDMESCSSSCSCIFKS